MQNRAGFARYRGRLALAGALALLVWAWFGSAMLAPYHEDLIYLARQHLWLVAVSMSWALAIGLVSGVLLSRPRLRRWAEPVMQLFNIGNTLPPMAVLALAMVVLGVGDHPAIVALCLTSLLPIVRSTYSGLAAVPAALTEAADGIGMTAWQRLVRVELPNALPYIVSGLRVALAINVGTAPLAFLIGASSFGELIFPGIYLNQPDALFIGAAATALVAFVLDYLVAALGRRLTPGLAA